jgi:hypothetical protein
MSKYSITLNDMVAPHDHLHINKDEKVIPDGWEHWANCSVYRIALLGKAASDAQCKIMIQPDAFDHLGNKLPENIVSVLIPAGIDRSTDSFRIFSRTVALGLMSDVIPHTIPLDKKENNDAGESMVETSG